MSRVLVTGGSGFLGRPLVERLAHAGYEVHLASRTSRDSSPNHHPCDLTQAGEAAALIRLVQPEILIHLAWHTEHGDYWKSPKNEIWKHSSLELFQEFARSRGAFAMAAGTSAEYAWTSQKGLDEETTTLEPASVYGASKLALWREGRSILSSAGIPLCWVRLFNPFGPGEDIRRLIPKVCLSLLREESFAMDAAAELRDFLHVHEVAAGFLALLQKRCEGPVNLGSGEPRSIREVVEAIAKCLERESLIHFGGISKIQPGSVFASTFRLRQSTGWQPSQSFTEQVASTCAWWKSQFSRT